MTLTESSPRIEIEPVSPRGEKSRIFGPTREELALYELRDLLWIKGGEAARNILTSMAEDISRGNYDVVKYLRAYTKLVEINGNDKI